MKNNIGGKIITLEQSSKIISRLVAVDAHYPNLKQLLDSEPGVVVKVDPDTSLADPYKLTALRLSEWSPVATAIACAYRLMTSFPTQFPENDLPHDSPKAIWGHSHNNWQAALMCLMFFKNIRGKAMFNWKKKSRDNVSRWQGLTTDADAVEATQNSRQETDYLAGFDLAFENNPQLKGLTSSSTADLIEEADREELVRALGLDQDAVQNSHTLSDAVHKKLMSRLESFAPHSNPAKLRNPEPPAQLPVTDANITELITYLRGRANVKYDQYIDKEDALLGSGKTDPKNVRLSAIAEEEEMALIAAERENSVPGDEDDDISIEDLRATRQQMGTFLPPQEGLVEVCKSFGIGDWRNPKVPGTQEDAKVPKPHQLTGK